MAKKRKGMNAHQKAIFKAGDHRTRQGDVEYYLELSRSTDPTERLEAAQNLCPCHVRRKIDDVWRALFRMMEDSDSLVRRAAWHTLEDGGVPDDPAIAPIFQRAVANLDRESDRSTRLFIQEFAVPFIRASEQVDLERKRLSADRYREKGKCDFCGQSGVGIRREYDTEIKDNNGSMRFGNICKECDS